jgi:putative oxidoreductase
MKSNVNDLALLLLRLAVGAVMWAHGAQKLLGLFGGHGPQGFVHVVVGLGMPPALGWLAIAIEFFGGIAIALGVLSRLAALGFAGEMAVAIAKVHWQNGFFMNGTGAGGRGQGFEYPLVLGVVALALFLVGPGRYALFGRTRNLLA